MVVFVKDGGVRFTMFVLLLRRADDRMGPGSMIRSARCPKPERFATGRSRVEFSSVIVLTRKRRSTAAILSKRNSLVVLSSIMLRRCLVRCSPFLELSKFVGPRCPQDLEAGFNDALFTEFCEKESSKSPFFVHTFLRTPAKMRIDSLIEAKLRELSKGGFRFSVGPQSNLIFGERGMGKTDSLRRAAMRASCRYDNVISIYVEYSSEAQEPQLPSQLIFDALQQRGVVPQAQQTPDRLQAVLEILAENDTFVLLIADEFDQLFLLPEHNAAALRTIREYSFLGCSSMGRVSPILSGSSGTLPLLISGGGRRNDTLRREYPLCKLTPGMNGTKYEAIRVTEERCDAAAVKHIMEHFFPDGAEAMRRIMYFFCAATWAIYRNSPKASRLGRAATRGAFALRPLITSLAP